MINHFNLENKCLCATLTVRYILNSQLQNSNILTLLIRSTTQRSKKCSRQDIPSWNVPLDVSCKRLFVYNVFSSGKFSRHKRMEINNNHRRRSKISFNNKLFMQLILIKITNQLTFHSQYEDCNSTRTAIFTTYRNGVLT